MKKDIFEVSTEVKNRAIDLCNRLNSELTLITRKSTHKDDAHLYVVVGKKRNPLWEGKEYCVWTLNTSLDGLYDGVYDVDSITAFKTLSDRLWDYEENEIDPILVWIEENMEEINRVFSVDSSKFSPVQCTPEFYNEYLVTVYDTREGLNAAYADAPFINDGDKEDAFAFLNRVGTADIIAGKYVDFDYTNYNDILEEKEEGETV